MKHSYLYIILSLCLTVAFFLGGCAQDLQTPDTAENDVEILSDMAAPSASPSPTVTPETDTPDIPDKLPKPEGNAQESEESRRALYERAEPLYQDELSFLENVSYFENGFSYTFADIGNQYPVMLATGETFTYDITESIQACMQCNVYYYDGSDVRLFDSLSSLGTAYPIAFDETGLYEAGPKGVRRLSIRMEGKYLKLVVVEAAYVSYDEDGNSSYYSEKDGEPVEISASDYQQLFTKYQAASIAQFEGSAPSMPAESLALMQCLEGASGHKMEEYVYVDMDHDGKNEMIGAYEDDSYDWSVWYANNDGTICQPVPGSEQGFDTCRFELLSLPSETHIVINEVNLMGNNKRYSIYGLNNQEMYPLVHDQYGYVYQNSNGDIILDVEDYDAHYDIVDDLFTGHTWSDTYLYYEDGSYKEYGAVILSEEQFLRYDNAAELLSDICSEADDGEIEFVYFLRENGIVHVQCILTIENVSIDYFHYTFRAEENHLTGSLESKNEGRMGTYFSTLEVTYPEAEVFPSR